MIIKQVYVRIGFALMPEFPSVTSEAKAKIANKSALLIDWQIANQPYYLSYPLRLISHFLSASILVFGPGVIKVWAYLPMGGMVERLFRSLVTLIFLEDETVLGKVGELTGEEKVLKFRAIRNG